MHCTQMIDTLSEWHQSLPCSVVREGQRGKWGGKGGGEREREGGGGRGRGGGGRERRRRKGEEER